MPATAGVPEFRDPKTGQIWTPNNVGLVPGPNTPADRAFDPLGQAVRVDGVVVQRPKVTPLGAVPITAGPTVPVVNIENATLRAVPEQRWQVVLYLNNNSGRTVVPLLHCSFTNAGKPVEQTRVLAPGGWRWRARRAHGLRSEDQPLRRSRHLQGRVALGAALIPGRNSRRRP